jgi:putative acetyltransferase
MQIRPERVEDYAAIAAIHVRAFDNRSGEPTVVALLRQRRGFDPSLSLVAEIDGEIVGHVLFFPYTVRLLNTDVPAVSLAPIAVAPEHQREGIGSRLIAEGHAQAASLGYPFSFLLGHSSYYPRFGYRTRAYGPASANVAVSALPEINLSSHPPTAADIDALWDLWWRDQSSVDLALDPGHDLLNWLSPNPAVRAAVYTDGTEIVGYTRIHSAEPSKPRVFLAVDEAAARAVAATVAQEHGIRSELDLPIHPLSASAAAFPYASVVPWNAAMVCPLNPSPLDDYLRLLEAGERPPGCVTWPPEFDLT